MEIIRDAVVAPGEGSVTPKMTFEQDYLFISSSLFTAPSVFSLLRSIIYVLTE